MPKKMKQKGNPKVHEDLSGFDIKISPFGELETNLNVDKLNSFLDATVVDKKLTEEQLADKLDISEEE